jgi:hypothetical protein
MPLDEESRELVESFRQYVEDSVANDDRYGPAGRYDAEDESTLATRFDGGASCWFEVAVQPAALRVRVGFFTSSRETAEELEQTIQDAEQTMGAFVGAGFVEAGLDWEKPNVEYYHEGDKCYCFVTSLTVDEPVDLERPEVRDKVLRMLEGYLIAFGPAIVLDEEE